MTTKKSAKANLTTTKPHPMKGRSLKPKVYDPETKPDDTVPFRPTLDEHSKRLVKRLGSHWRVRGVHVILRLIERYSASKAASQPLVSFIRNSMPDIEDKSFKDRNGMLFLMKKSRHDDLRDLAFDPRWDVAGNMSRMLRILIYHTAELEGIPMPKITASEFAEQMAKKEAAKLERKKAKEKALRLAGQG